MCNTNDFLKVPYIIHFQFTPYCIDIYNQQVSSKVLCSKNSYHGMDSSCIQAHTASRSGININIIAYYALYF